MTKIKRGDVIQFQLPNGKYAYARLIQSTLFGFCRELSDKPYTFPKNMDDCFFKVWFQGDVIEDGTCPIIANIPLITEEEKKFHLWEVKILFLVILFMKIKNSEKLPKKNVKVLNLLKFLFLSQ